MRKKDKQHALVPRLRFPEFWDGAEWEENKIEALAQVKQGGTPSTSNPKYWDGIINWLKPAEMGKGDSPYISSTKRTLTEEGLRNCSSELLPAHSVIVSTRAPIGHLAINNLPTAINQGCRGLVPVEDAQFLYYALLQAKPRLMGFGAGNTFKELSGSALRRFVLPAPLPAEQQKIADCLGSLDDLITAEGRKLAALRDHKKGLMQQLFPREGETRPRLRFPEFLKHELAFEQISKFAEVTTGDKDTQNKVDEGQYPFFVRSQKVERINSYSYDGEAVLTSGDGVGVGENYHYIDGRFDFHQRVYCICEFSSEVNGRYFFHYFSQHFKKRVKQMSAKNSVDSVRMAMITEMPIWLPKIEEQHRIANCLSALDSQIAAQAKKLDALRTHKRGLMQRLFPAPEGA